MERSIMEDVRLVKQMMETLQKKILTYDGVNSTFETILSNIILISLLRNFVATKNLQIKN